LATPQSMWMAYIYDTFFYLASIFYCFYKTFFRKDFLKFLGIVCD